MSDNLVTKMGIENRRLKNANQDLTFKLVRLIAYVINMQDDHPDMAWPEFPDTYSGLVWKYAA
jgi:hypothetical protein